MQQYLGIDFLILYALLGITLFIGLRTGRGIKDIKEYATGNKTFTTGALVLTWLATDIAGETILDMSHSIRTEGIIQILTLTGGVGIALLMQGLVFAPQFTKFPSCMTMGDVMQTLYGGPSQVITGIFAFLTAVCIAGMEVTVLGLLAEQLLGINFYWGTAIGGFLLVIYTVHGGIKSVAYTDILQFLILAIIIPIITITCLQQVGGIHEMLMQVPSDKLTILQHPKLGYYFTLFISLSIFQFSVIDPALMQRILLGGSKQQLRNQFLVVSTVFFAVMLSVLLLGLSSLILFPDDSIVAIIPHVIHNLLPTGMKGLASAGLFAITMSTFDSFLHAAGLTLVHDVIGPICAVSNKKFNELKVTRYITLLVGCLVIIIGLFRAQNLYAFVETSYIFVGPLLAFPLFAGVLGLKPYLRAFYTASIVTIITLIICKCKLPEDYDYLSGFIGVCANGILFLGIHLIHNKGFAIINYEANTMHVVKPDPKSWRHRLKPYLPTPKNIFTLSTREVNRLGAPHILLGIFGAINYIVPGYMWEHHTVEGANLMSYLRAIAALACGFMALKDQWSRKLSNYFPLFWHTTLCFCLPFLNTFMLLMTNVSVSWLVNIAMSIVLLIMLVDWTMFLILSAIGISLGFLFYSKVVGPIQVDLDFSSGYFLAYQILFSLLICGLFISKGHRRYALLAAERKEAEEKEQSNLAAYEKAYQERLAVIQELRNGHIDDMPDVMRGIQTLKAQIQEAEANKTAVDLAAWKTLIKEVDKKLTPISFSIVALDHRALNYLRLPEIGPIEMRTLLADLQSQFPHQRIQYLGNTKKATITCGIPQLKTVMYNMTQILSSSVTKTVCIAIEDTVLEYPAPNVKYQHVKRIPAFRFAFTDDPTSIKPVDYTYYVNMRGSVIPAAAGKNSMMLASNHRIVRAHYGYTNVDISQTKDYKYYAYVFPEDLEEVRPKDMNSPAMELGAALVRANDKYPGAQEQEEEFLRELASKTTVNMENVVETLELIKWYHGSVMRRSGEPFYLHPLAVARIVLDWTTDEDVIIGALLHDTVEDTRMLLEQVDMKFGPIVRNIVDCVTHFESYQASFYKLKLSEHENISMLLEKADRRALLVKVADCMHNMRTIDGHKSEEKKRKIAEDTLKFYVPLSLTLNLPQIDIDELRLRSEKVLENR